MRHTGGGVDPRQGHDLRGVSDASLRAHGPLIHDHDAFESSRNGSAFSTQIQVSTRMPPVNSSVHPPREPLQTTAEPQTVQIGEPVQSMAGILARLGYDEWRATHLEGNSTLSVGLRWMILILPLKDGVGVQAEFKPLGVLVLRVVAAHRVSLLQRIYVSTPP